MAMHSSFTPSSLGPNSLLILFRISKCPVILALPAGYKHSHGNCEPIRLIFVFVSTERWELHAASFDRSVFRLKFRVYRQGAIAKDRMLLEELRFTKFQMFVCATKEIELAKSLHI